MLIAVKKKQYVFVIVAELVFSYIKQNVVDAVEDFPKRILATHLYQEATMNKLLAVLCTLLTIMLIILNGVIATYIPDNYMMLWYVACIPLGMLYAAIGMGLYVLGGLDE